MRHKLTLIGIALICLYQAACGCFCVTGHRWGVTPAVPMSLVAGAPFPPNFEQEFTAAENSWTLASLGFFIFQNGPPSVGGFSQFVPDGVNAVDFIFLPAVGAPPDALAVTVIVDSDVFGCGNLEVDMAFNSLPPGGAIWDSSGVPQLDHIDIQSIALHELGHVLTLDHVGCPEDSIMLPGYNMISQNFSRVKRDLSGCDIAGIDLIYIAQSPPCLPLSGFCFFGSILGANPDESQLYLNAEFSALVDTHQDEVLQIVAGDPQLLLDARNTAMEYQPMLAQLAANDPAVANRKIEDKDVKKADDLLDRLRVHASKGLKQDIDKVRKKAHDLEGHSATEAFSTAFLVFKPPKPGGNK